MADKSPSGPSQSSKRKAGRGKPSRDGVELELKFELSPGQARTLCQSDAFKAVQLGGQPRRKTMRATYFDTPDLKLSARGVSLRVRKESRRYVQCVKANASAMRAGGFARREWEWQMPGPAPDLSVLKTEAGIKDVFKGINTKKLVPIFSTDITRQSRDLVAPGGANIKCDIDKGTIISGDARAPIHEMELELASGDATELLELGRMVTAIVPARLSQRTKARRGYRLHAGLGHVWVKARAVTLSDDATAEDVLSASLNEGIRHLLANEDCVLTRCDVEGVHQMRVALRRMRAAITTYKKLFAKGSFETVADGLKAAGTALGPARDWDVFATELLAPLRARFPDDADLEILAGAVETRRDKAYEQAQDMIRSTAYARTLTDLLHWLGTRPWRGEGADLELLDAPADRAAAVILNKRHKALLKAGEGMKCLTATERHQARIAGKKVRYAAEFFAPVYAPKKTWRYIKALKTLQDELGHLNDLANMRAMLDGLTDNARGAKSKPVARAAGIVEGWYAHAQAGGGDPALKAWERFTKAKPFW